MSGAKSATWKSGTHLVLHGGTRKCGKDSGTGTIGAVGANRPLAQCAQRKRWCWSMRRMKASTDSVTTGSGAGTESAMRACASCAALCAGPISPQWRMRLNPLCRR
jgi:hypothetical protein